MVRKSGNWHLLHVPWSIGWLVNQSITLWNPFQQRSDFKKYIFQKIFKVYFLKCAIQYALSELYKFIFLQIELSGIIFELDNLKRGIKFNKIHYIFYYYIINLNLNWIIHWILKISLPRLANGGRVEWAAEAFSEFLDC